MPVQQPGPSRARRVALATSRGMASLDDDGPALRAALGRLGVDAAPVVWDDPDVDWSAYAAVVVRSTWDYVERREEFVAWAEAVGELTTLRNPAQVLRQNTDKSYLRSLSYAGVPVVDTCWVAPGEHPDLVALGWPELVVKPAVSGGARDTIRTADHEAAVRHLALIAASGRTAMVQPYLGTVEGVGETSVVFLAGRCSHAVRKGPMLVPEAGDPRYDITPRVPAADELALAEAALEAVPERADLLYARVDMVRGEDGGPVLMELELTEPALFLSYADGAADRLAVAISDLT
ncbi:MAG: hypothetical protein M3Z02_11380 [Actinomycetota bacterium]|nr:hypothetical protein [Actinomycetota bacterium]